MAEELIAATVRVLLEKTIAVAADRIGLMLGVYDDLKEMEGHAKDIQSLLSDAEAKQSKNTALLSWLKNVEGAAFEAEHVLDELLYESLSWMSFSTTLAKLVFNNGKIVNHFGKRSWICVSDKFEVTGILKGILESLKGGKKLEMSSRDAIVHGIQEELRGGRFLFVLDDVWNEDSELWDILFTSLIGLNSANGSCCVLTTRLQTTANLVCPSYLNPFVLGRLSNNDCWFIIGRKATKGKEMPTELEIHKEEILKKCQGLPLAANIIGGLLGLQRKEDWLSIVENKILKVSEGIEGKITQILKLSYDYLPYPHIMKCFAYCSVYSKDREMDGQTLIELWMAEGFLKNDVEGRTTMEDVGKDYLTILLQSSLLEKIIDGGYQMHDLVHDLAESISELEQFDEEYKYLQCRHLALGEKKLKENWNAKAKVAQIVKGDISHEMLVRYRHVRVLQLYGTRRKTLPSLDYSWL